MAKNEKQALLTFADVKDPMSPRAFKNDKERIKYMSQAYKHMSLSKAFSIFYNLEISEDVKTDKLINVVNDIQIGKIYSGTVKSITKDGIVFTLPGVKDDIVSKENFMDTIDHINNYLLTHDNKLLFEVREKQKDKYIVSVESAYYRQWLNEVEKCIKQENGIQITIDSLGNAGYNCHCQIWTLAEAIGKNYTSAVFIPGSHIVLNIETDFEKWIGETMVIIPQKIVQFKKNFDGTSVNSIVGSRKRVLQITGMVNMEKIYNRYQLGQKPGITYVPDVFEGTVTGIINSNKKTGAFIELDGQYITGLLPIDSANLLDYRPGDKLKVVIEEFEKQEGRPPFIYNKRGKLIHCNLRPVFKKA